MTFKIAAIAGALAAVGTPLAASAMPAVVVGTAPAPVVTLISGGCGIGFHRGPWGGCRPNVVWRAPGPRVVVVRPAWGWHRPYYWRRFHRW